MFGRGNETFALIFPVVVLTGGLALPILAAAALARAVARGVHPGATPVR